MRTPVLLLFALTVACQPSAPTQTTTPKPIPNADGPAFLAGARTLPVGETFRVGSGNSDWVVVRDGVSAKAVELLSGKSLTLPNAQITWVVGDPDGLTATREEGKVTILRAGKTIAEVSVTTPRWERGTSPQAAMAFDGDALWIVTHDAILRWENNAYERMHTFDGGVSRLIFRKGSVSFFNGDGWDVVRPNGILSFMGDYGALWLSDDGTRIYRRSGEGVEVAPVDTLAFEFIDGTQEIDGVFPLGGKLLGQWWSAQASWKSEWADAAWLSENAVETGFKWGASGALTVDRGGELVGLSPSPGAVWRKSGQTVIQLEAAASGAIAFDGKTIVRRHEGEVQRIALAQSSNVFPLRLVRQIACDADTCVVAGRDGVLDVVDVARGTRRALAFVHPGELMPPVLEIGGGKATVLCEPRCVTADGGFVGGVVAFDLAGGSSVSVMTSPRIADPVVPAEDQPKPKEIARDTWVTGGRTVALIEPVRDGHKIGRPPRFSELEVEGLEITGDFAKPKDFVVVPDGIVVATAKRLARFGGKTFDVEAPGAYALTVVGDEVWHLSGRGADTKVVARDASLGTVKREEAWPGVTAFAPTAQGVLLALEDGRLMVKSR